MVSWSEFDFDASSSPAEGPLDYTTWGDRQALLPAQPAEDDKPTSREPAAGSPYAVVHHPEEAAALRSRDSNIMLQLIDTYLAGEHGIEGEDDEQELAPTGTHGGRPPVR